MAFSWGVCPSKVHLFHFSSIRLSCAFDPALGNCQIITRIRLVDGFLDSLSIIQNLCKNQYEIW